jgi:hypothetical protein
VIAGAALVLIAPFLSWVHVVILGDLNLFNLLSAGNTSRLWALIPMALAVWVIVAAVRRSSRTRGLGLVVGIVAALVDGLFLIALLHDVRRAYGLAQVQLGPWLGVGGAVLMIAASATAKTGADDVAGSVVSAKPPGQSP